MVYKNGGPTRFYQSTTLLLYVHKSAILWRSNRYYRVTQHPSYTFIDTIYTRISYFRIVFFNNFDRSPNIKRTCILISRAPFFPAILFILIADCTRGRKELEKSHEQNGISREFTIVVRRRRRRRRGSTSRSLLYYKCVPQHSDRNNTLIDRRHYRNKMSYGRDEIFVNKSDVKKL